MTWTLANSVTWTGDRAENNTAMEYLFDTYLPSRGWTTGAHPDGSSFKRVFSYGATDSLQGGTWRSYFWANWTSATASTSCSIYEDATYTASPGDLATDTTNSRSIQYNDSSYSFYGANWRFWTSDQVANATLVTRNKKVIWYHPGFDTAAFVQAGTWNGTDDNPNTCIWPMNTDGAMYSTNSPISTGVSGSTYVLAPQPWYNNQYQGLMPEIFFTNFGMNYNSSFDYGPAFFINQSDVRYHVPAALNSSSRTAYGSAFNLNGVLLLANSRYWIRSQADMNQPSLIFDFGTSEPDLT
jgi:hypothetical protein